MRKPKAGPRPKKKEGSYSRKTAHDQALEAAAIAQEQNKGKVMKRVDHRTWYLVDKEEMSPTHWSLAIDKEYG